MSDHSWIDDLDEIAVDIDLKLHPVHADPKAEVIIISDDYVKFRASKFHLTRTSQFFEDLIETVRHEEHQEESIHLEFPSTTIALFLDLAGVCDPYIPIVSTNRARSLLDFVEFTLSDGLIDTARSTLMEAAKHHPFELLVIASQGDDLDLAKHALRNITSSAFREEFILRVPFVEDTEYKIGSLKEYLLRLTPAYHLAILIRSCTLARYNRLITMTNGSILDLRYYPPITGPASPIVLIPPDSSSLRRIEEYREWY
ncbi:hypothetical protein I302_103942 [Kwoniella bestiolae CBS 10118]|uniref:BTB domain-containing protein n=1 Tax=Kwoniella bestiolae CBS 10118 TaxID=1296100 RepID=A0A1B9G9V5_9TREE|nr:hypothetical protein I302_02648 [Kwoniella bestiolae CBS 10118]OCF27799.1 hypothetical protein I302_02648 [Kwoniella bestiolae CBS 10118]